MTQSAQSPQWVLYLSALSVPVFALIGAWIAARQMLIADEKLRHDAFFRLYDRRVAAYEATRKILAAMYGGKSASEKEKEIEVYGLITLDAEFLFDKDMFNYLRQIHRRLSILVEADSSIHSLPPGAERDEYERIARENLDWVRQQGDDATGFQTKFADFLIFKATKRPWWLRYPIV
jgi:hypothetical protein